MTFIEDAREVLGMPTSPDLNDEEICAAMLLAACSVGARIGKLSKALEITPDRVRWIFYNLRNQGVFTRAGRVCAEWDDSESGRAAFVMDVAVGLGLLERST